MKSSAVLALVLTFSGLYTLSLAFTPEEQILIDQLLEHKDEIQISVSNALFGTNLGPKPKDELTCTACRTAMLVVLGWVHQGLPEDDIAYNVKGLCRTLINPVICDDVVDQYLGVAMYIINERPWLNRFDICGIIMGGSLDVDCRTVNESMIGWDVNVPGQKPPVVERPYLPEGIPTTKVLHLTDIHPDLHYAPGSLAECGSFLCCRSSEADDPTNTSISAGPWGDYRDCDAPISAVEAIFHDAATRHQDAEFVIMTGDLTHHAIWIYTLEDNLNHYQSVFRLLRQEFGEKTIYPVVGNHEPVPCNLFPTRDIAAAAPEHNISWVYETLAQEFASSLTPSALETFRAAGYYTLLHKPGFRVIALNTNFCYTLNFWILHTPEDPENQLQWLSQTLDEAEKNQEVVWIIGHVPPGGDDCWYYWSQKYSSIINRYEAIIRAQFFGHTHNDEIQIFFDMTEDPPRPTGSLYITTSVTPYSYINPGYKVFYADGVGEGTNRNASWEIVDHEAYIYNVTAANLAGASEKPIIYKEYSAKEEYGLRSFRPNDLYDLVERMALNNTLFQKYYKFWQMGYDGAEICVSVECKLENLCPLVQTDYSTANCDRLEALMFSGGHTTTSTPPSTTATQA